MRPPPHRWAGAVDRGPRAEEGQGPPRGAHTVHSGVPRGALKSASLPPLTPHTHRGSDQGSAAPAERRWCSGPPESQRHRHSHGNQRGTCCRGRGLWRLRVRAGRRRGDGGGWREGERKRPRLQRPETGRGRSVASTGKRLAVQGRGRGRRGLRPPSRAWEWQDQGRPGKTRLVSAQGNGSQAHPPGRGGRGWCHPLSLAFEESES